MQLQHYFTRSFISCTSQGFHTRE